MASPFKIRVEHVSKIFGPDPKAALAKVNAGMSKTDLLVQSKSILGLHDISLNIRAGETFVIMGLSGSGKTTLIRHDLDEALLIGDHIAILKDGLLRQVGTGSDILVAPADDYVARFVRDVNRARIVTCGDLAVPGQGVGDTVLTSDQTIESAYGALASSDAPITVRHANGDLAGVLTRQRVFDTLART